jgi:hypothetical protein
MHKRTWPRYGELFSLRVAVLRRSPLKLRALVIAALVVGAFPAISAIAEPPVCPTVEAPELSFADPKYIDRQRAGGEPVSVVAQDGSIIVGAHAGSTHIYKDPEAAPGARDFAVGYTNQTLHWRSVDGGDSWEFIGLLGQREGPHSASSTGFSDPDLTIDTSGRIYDVEIDLANIAVFSSTDDGQSFPFANPLSATADRPWLAGLGPDEVVLYVQNLVPTFWHSTNGGLTWSFVASDPPIFGKLITDPINPTDGLIAPTNSLGEFAISSNNGTSWTQHQFGPIGGSSEFFGTVAADRAGNVYQGAAGGYTVSYTYYERATGATNESQIDIPIPPGDAMWPWITAGDDGRVAMTWYQNLAGSPNEFYIFVAYTNNGHGTTVTCSDGSTKFIEPQFTVVNASKRPIHRGKICLQGTTCNANPSFEGGDRRLGDFFTINFDTKGDLFIVSADTMLENPLGGPKPVGNPIFIKQSGGDRALETPITTRTSRCLWPLPSC